MIIKLRKFEIEFSVGFILILLGLVISPLQWYEKLIWIGCVVLLGEMLEKNHIRNLELAVMK